MTPKELIREVELELERLKQTKFTGAMTLKFNITQGELGNIRMQQEWIIKNGNGKIKGIDNQ